MQEEIKTGGRGRQEAGGRVKIRRQEAGGKGRTGGRRQVAGGRRE